MTTWVAPVTGPQLNVAVWPVVMRLGDTVNHAITGAGHTGGGVFVLVGGTGLGTTMTTRTGVPKNTPFDPTAARAAAQSRLRVIFAEGRNLENLGRILAGQDFAGTTIGPD